MSKFDSCYTSTVLPKKRLKCQNLTAVRRQRLINISTFDSCEKCLKRQSLAAVTCQKILVTIENNLFFSPIHLRSKFRTKLYLFRESWLPQLLSIQFVHLTAEFHDDDDRGATLTDSRSENTATILRTSTSQTTSGSEQCFDMQHQRLQNVAGCATDEDRFRRLRSEMRFDFINLIVRNLFSSTRTI